MPDFVPNRRGHKPYANYDVTPFGGFLAGVGIGVGIIIAVRFGPALLTRVFIRKVGAFFTGQVIKNIIDTLVIGPIPGTRLGEDASILRQALAFANVGMWVTGMWNALFNAAQAAKNDLFDEAVDATIDFGLAHDLLFEVNHRPVVVIDEGLPIVIVINGAGTAMIAVGPAWRTDP